MNLFNSILYYGVYTIYFKAFQRGGPLRFILFDDIMDIKSPINNKNNK